MVLLSKMGRHMIVCNNVIALTPVDIVLSFDIKGCELAFIPLYPFFGSTFPDKAVIALLLHPCNYQLSKSIVHEIKFGDIAVM